MRNLLGTLLKFLGGLLGSPYPCRKECGEQPGGGNHPVVGDILYGKIDEFKLNGQLLHAFKLELIHPRTNEHMVFNAPLPDYFERVLEILRNKKV